jgi:hypothetical protein
MATTLKTTNQIITLILLTNQQQARGGSTHQTAVVASIKLNKISKIL